MSSGLSSSPGPPGPRHRRTLSSAETTTSVTVSSAFDGGNIQFVDSKTEGSHTEMIVRINPDPYTELEKTNHFMYFNFRATVSLHDNDDFHTVKYIVENAGEASFPEAWSGSTVFSTDTSHSDPDSWTRMLNTSYKNGKLFWTQKHTTSGSTYFAHFPPFSYERHLDLISKCNQAENAKVLSLGQSLDGREMECITVGTGGRTCWIIHRQHPGETMAEYYAEGLLNRLLGLNTNGSVDGMVHRALQLYTFYIVPNMCPDGSVKGYLRTNSCGANLNREWASTGAEDDSDFYEAPTMERSPEVAVVLRTMDETGVDAFLDVHGDEEIPFNFLAGAEGCANWGDRLMHLQGAFLASYCRANFDMNQKYGYPPGDPHVGPLNICSNQIAHRFDCLAVTLEMPYKDCLSNPDPVRGWTPARSGMLGASVLDALIYVHPHLRAEGEFWKDFPEADAYVRPTNEYHEEIGDHVNLNRY